VHPLAAAIIVFPVAIPNSHSHLFSKLFANLAVLTKMGKSSHNSRKRKKLSSSDYLAALEDKMTRVVT